MTFGDHRNRIRDEAFERTLLASAHADAAPHDVRQAWLRFDARLTALALDPRPAATRDIANAARSTTRLAATWALIGAVSGSLITALALSLLHAGFVRTPMRSTLPRAAQADARAAGLGAEPGPRVVQPRAAGAAALAPTTRSEPARAGRTSPRRAHIHDAEPSASAAPAALANLDVVNEAPSADSSLGAQIARVDAARAALARGAYDSALLWVERFHREFPQGELAPDAEVIALEALSARGDRPQLASRAQRFLERYPKDPHVARVRRLLADL